MTSVVMHQPRAEIAGPSLLKVQGTRKYWTSVVMKDAAHLKSKATMYGYYSGMFQAGRSIWNDQGPKGLYAGYWSTLARDVPFAGLMVMCYEALKDFTEYGRQKWFPNSSFHVNSSFEGLVLGGIAGGVSAYLTTPLDVIKTRLQIQGTIVRLEEANPSKLMQIWMESVKIGHVILLISFISSYIGYILCML